MIDLIIKNEKGVIDVPILKENNIIYNNKKQILDLYRNFDEVINEKNDTITINIGEKRLTNKDYILINLIDLQSVLDSIKFKKGSIIYEYLSILFENLDIEIQMEVNSFLEEVFEKIQKDFCFDSLITFDENLFKIFNTCSEFKPIIKDDEINIKIIKMLEYVINHKLDKKFIIFIDSSYINIDCIKNDNMYIFDFDKHKNINNYNLIFLDELRILDIDVLLNTIKLNWPIDYIDSEINDYLQQYFRYYYDKDIVDSKDVNIIVISKIINKIFLLNKKIIYDNLITTNIIRSFLDNF